MELKFFSIDEVREFVKGLKGTRGGKTDTDDAPAGDVPAPLQPPKSSPSYSGLWLELTFRSHRRQTASASLTITC